MSEANDRKSKHRFGPRIHGGSAGARKWAAVFLQVLAGEWTPTEGAKALGVSLPRYYAVETRAMSGLVTACEPRVKGKRRQSEKEVADLNRRVVWLERECARKQALLRVSLRTTGIQAPAPSAKPKRKRRPTVRALKMVAVLQKANDAERQEEGALS
jgi:hypothetical protein